MTGRYTTSGHLTSLGIGVGVGAGAVKAELFHLGFSHRHLWRRKMEGFAVPPSPLLGLNCSVKADAKEVRDDSSPRKRSHPPVSEEQGLMGDLLSGCGVKERC